VDWLHRGRGDAARRAGEIEIDSSAARRAKCPDERTSRFCETTSVHGGLQAPGEQGREAAAPSPGVYSGNRGPVFARCRWAVLDHRLGSGVRGPRSSARRRAAANAATDGLRWGKGLTGSVWGRRKGCAVTCEDYPSAQGGDDEYCDGEQKEHPHKFKGHLRLFTACASKKVRRKRKYCAKSRWRQPYWSIINLPLQLPSADLPAPHFAGAPPSESRPMGGTSFSVQIAITYPLACCGRPPARYSAQSSN
jgi:hypothetical protein